MPIGDEKGVTSSASDCSISSDRSNGSRASRSSLLTKMMIGTWRYRREIVRRHARTAGPRQRSFTPSARSRSRRRIADRAPKQLQF